MVILAIRQGPQQAQIVGAGEGRGIGDEHALGVARVARVAGQRLQLLGQDIARQRIGAVSGIGLDVPGGHHRVAVGLVHRGIVAPGVLVP